MPRPPILPALDWKAIHDSGIDWEAWLGGAEMPEHVERMRGILQSLAVDANRAAFLKNLPRPCRVVAIAEDWCGDVVRWAPVLEGLARVAGPDKLIVRYVARHEHPDVFARFLTNGGEAIPKFVFLSDQYTESGNWGPYPAECRRVMGRGKGSGNMKAARERVRLLYEADPSGEGAIREMLELIDAATCDAP